LNVLAAILFASWREAVIFFVINALILETGLLKLCADGRFGAEYAPAPQRFKSCAGVSGLGVVLSNPLGFCFSIAHLEQRVQRLA
jgi:hypothetical protein